MQKLTLTIEGTETYDLENALEEVKRLVSEGFTSGKDCNESGDFVFKVIEDGND